MVVVLSCALLGIEVVELEGGKRHTYLPLEELGQARICAYLSSALFTFTATLGFISL